MKGPLKYIYIYIYIVTQVHTFNIYKHISTACTIHTHTEFSTHIQAHTNIFKERARNKKYLIIQFASQRTLHGISENETKIK